MPLCALAFVLPLSDESLFLQEALGRWRNLATCREHCTRLGYATNKGIDVQGIEGGVPGFEAQKKA
jgi:hypothetical protein